MNQLQALREARRRWGAHGAIKLDGERRVVGEILLGLAFSVKGEGRTWALAFAQCDRKECASELWRQASGQPCPLCSRTIIEQGWGRPVYDPESEPPTLDDVICSSCWLDSKLPAVCHRWSEDRKRGFHRFGTLLGQWVSCLATGNVVGFRRANIALPEYVEAAEVGYSEAIYRRRERERRRHAKRRARA